MTSRVCSGFAFGLAAVLILASCGDSGSSATGSDSAPTTVAQTPSVKVAEIRAAVSAVEAQLGGKQRFSEVNATQTEVNVFVVKADGSESAYLVRGGKVEPPDSSETYAGATFTASEIEFTPTVLDRVTRDIGDAELVAFSITPHGATSQEGGGVDYIATLTAPGGEFRVLVAADGEVLSTSAISPATGP